MTDQLWAPWRMEYLRQLAPEITPASKTIDTGNTTAAESVSTRPNSAAPACFLCDAAQVSRASGRDADRLVLVHDERGMILLNKFPYTNGHLLIAPPTHTPDLTDLTPAHRAGLIELTAFAEEILRASINPQGFNVGINLGRCAGAGVPGHIHFHVVPRWAGDVNFMSTVGGVRVIPEAISESYRFLAMTLDKLRFSQRNG